MDSPQPALASPKKKGGPLFYFFDVTGFPGVAQVAVDYLVENLKKTLYLEKEESVPVYELLSVVAAQYNMTAEHYCEVSLGVASAVFNAPRSISCVQKPYRTLVVLT